MVYLCIWGETMLFCFVSIYGSWTLESMEFSNSFKFEPTDPKQCAGSHSSHLSCHHSHCVWPTGLLGGCDGTTPGKVHWQCVTYCSYCSLDLRLEVPSPGKLLLTYEVGIRSPCPWYHSTLAFYPSPASLLPGNFSIQNAHKSSKMVRVEIYGSCCRFSTIQHEVTAKDSIVVHSLSCVSLCDPMHYSTQASLSFTREGHTGLVPF